MVAGLRDHRQRHLGQRQQPVTLGRKPETSGGVGVDHAAGVRAADMHGAVDREAGNVDAVL